MSKQAFGSTRKLHKLAIVVLVCGVAASLAGCVRVTHSGPYTAVAFGQQDSRVLDVNHVGRCDRNVNCTFVLIRANVCNGLKDPAGKLVCYAGTKPNNLATGYSFALTLAAWEQAGRNGCLAIDNNGGAHWKREAIGHGGCQP
jgi:hypothetical protein